MEFCVINNNMYYNNLFNTILDKLLNINYLFLFIISISLIIGIYFFILLNYGGEEEHCYCDDGCNCGCDHKKVKLRGKNNFKSDIPLAWGLYFQDGATPSFEGIVDLHNRIMFYLVVILFGVSWIMLSIMWNFNTSENKLVYRYLNHGTLIELIWTVGPALVLVAIAFPSFKLLYLMDNYFVLTYRDK